MTGIELDPDRLARLLAAALRLGVERLPATLRANGERVGVEGLALQALLVRARPGQTGPHVDGSCGGGHRDGVPLLYCYADAAALLGVSERSLKRLLAAGELKAVHVGGSRRIAHSELIDFVARKIEEAA